MFDGKIEIWPLVYSENVKRNTEFHTKGTAMTKVVEVLNKEETQKMIIEKVLLAICENFPSSEKNSCI